MSWASLEVDPGMRISFLIIVLSERMRVTRICPDSLGTRKDTLYQTFGRMGYDQLAGGKVHLCLVCEMSAPGGVPDSVPPALLPRDAREYRYQPLAMRDEIIALEVGEKWQNDMGNLDALWSVVAFFEL